MPICLFFLLDRSVVGSVKSFIIVYVDSNKLGFAEFFKSARSLDNHTASFAARQQAIYSASQVEVATHICFLDFQQTAPPATRNTISLVDFRVSRHPAQSASAYP